MNCLSMLAAVLNSCLAAVAAAVVCSEEHLHMQTCCLSAEFES